MARRPESNTTPPNFEATVDWPLIDKYNVAIQFRAENQVGSMSSQTRIVASALVVVLSTMIASPVRSQDRANLEKRITTLERVVLSMAKRIEDLEAQIEARDRKADLSAELKFADLDGKAFLVSEDGVFLGLISSSEIETKSLLNSVGEYGSTIGSKSIFNEVGKYGGVISPQSPWNEIASRPPKVMLDDRFIGFLTKNSLKRPRIDPDALMGYLKSKR